MLKERHWATTRIIDKIRTNGCNTAATLTFPAGRYANETDEEPREVDDAFAARLDDLFRRGGDLVLETYRGVGDDGGPCYEAFILDPQYVEEHIAEYHRTLDTTDEKSPEPEIARAILFEQHYLIAHPRQFWVVWAGPY